MSVGVKEYACRFYGIFYDACRKSVSIVYSKQWKRIFRNFRVRTTGGIRDRGGIAYSVNLVFKFSR